MIAPTADVAALRAIVCRYLQRVGGLSADAREDAVQTAFAAALASPELCGVGWLCRTAKRAAFTARRSAARSALRAAYVHEGAPAYYGGNPVADAIAAERARLARRMLTTPAGQRWQTTTDKTTRHRAANELRQRFANACD